MVFAWEVFSSDWCNWFPIRVVVVVLCGLFEPTTVPTTPTSAGCLLGEESRISVAPADMQTGITRGSLEAAAAYLRLLDLISILSERHVVRRGSVLVRSMTSLQSFLVFDARAPLAAKARCLHLFHYP